MRSRTTAAPARATSRSRTPHVASLTATPQDAAAPSSNAAADPNAIAALQLALAAWNIADGPDEAHGVRWTVYTALRALLAFVLAGWASTAGKVAAYAFEEAARTAEEGATWEEPRGDLDGSLDKPIDAEFLRFVIDNAAARPRVEVAFWKYGAPRSWQRRHSPTAPTRGLLVHWHDDPEVLAERVTRAVNRHLDAALKLAEVTS